MRFTSRTALLGAALCLPLVAALASAALVGDPAAPAVDPVVVVGEDAPAWATSTTTTTTTTAPPPPPAPPPATTVVPHAPPVVGDDDADDLGEDDDDDDGD